MKDILLRLNKNFSINSCRRLIFALVIKFKSRKLNFSNVNSKDPKRILLASSIGGNATMSGFELFLSKYFRSRGHVVSSVLCDKTLPVCFECNYLNKGKAKEFSDNYSDNFCLGCPTAGVVNVKDIQYLSMEANDWQLKDFRQLISKMNINEMLEFKYLGINLGDHAKSGTLRFLAQGRIKNNDYEISVLRNYLLASFVTMLAFNKILEKYIPDVVILIHGLYVPHGVIAEICRSRNIKVITWNLGYREQTFIFSKDDTYHRTLLNVSNSDWEKIEWNYEKENSIIEYLKSRRNGENDWISFGHKNNSLVRNNDKMLKLKGIASNFEKNKIVTLLTNVAWDAQIHYRQNIFVDMYEWLESTIKWFSEKPDFLLIIRIHPAEVTSKYPSQERTKDFIYSLVDCWPNNIVIIPPEDTLNTYEVCDLSETTIIYGTKMGIELATKGKKVIVAGESWVKNKGLSFDPKSVQDYISLLEQIPSLKLPRYFTVERSLKFAYYFFFIRYVEIRNVSKFIDPSCIVLNSKFKEVDLDTQKNLDNLLT